jgi:hypothetical protein
MKIHIKKQIGKALISFEVEEAKQKDSLFTAGVLASTPTKCDICGSQDVSLSGNKAKGFTFVKVVCNKCGAKSDLGEYKDGGFYWKAFEQYQTKDQEKEQPKEDIPIIEDEGVDVEEIPFYI